MFVGGLASVGLAVAANASSADVASDSLYSEELVVTGTRLAPRVGAMPATVTLIDRAAIEAAQPQNALELLRMLGGLNVSQYGGRGGVSTVFLRGAEPNFTAVLIDGVRVNDPTDSRGGAFDFASLNVAEIERVEIVRGALSAVYGSDALAGAINIITSGSSEQLAVSIDARLSEDDSGGALFRLGAPVGRFSDLALVLGTDMEGEIVDGNDFENTTLGVRFATTRPRSRIVLSARSTQSESMSYPEDSGGPDLAAQPLLDQRDKDVTTASVAASYNPTGTTRWFANAAYTRLDESFESPGILSGVRDGVPPNRADSRLSRWQVGAHVIQDIGATGAFTLGVDANRDSGRATGSVEFAPGFELPTDFRLRRDVLGAFAELAQHRGSVSSGAIDLSASLRIDDAEREAAQVTGRIGAQYTRAGLRVFANWSEGFKLPSFFALGHALVGNPDLRPETSTNWELGLMHTWEAAQVQIQASVFQNRFRNLIDFDFDLFTNVNRDQVRARGAETAILWTPLTELKLRADVSYTDVDIRNSAAQLRQRPQWRGGVNVNWQLTRSLQANIDWRKRGNAFDSSVPTGGTTLSGSQRLNATLSLDLQPFTLWLGVQDLFSQDDGFALGFPTGGRRATLGLRYRFAGDARRGAGRGQ